MATFYDQITAAQTELIAQSHLFFVATTDPSFASSADGAGPVNVSPRGGTPLHVIDPHRVARNGLMSTA